MSVSRRKNDRFTCEHSSLGFNPFIVYCEHSCILNPIMLDYHRKVIL